MFSFAGGYKLSDSKRGGATNLPTRSAVDEPLVPLSQDGPWSAPASADADRLS